MALLAEGEEGGGGEKQQEIFFSSMWGHSKAAVCQPGRESWPELTMLPPWSWMSNLQNHKTINFLVYTTQSVMFIMAVWAD
jgi:hypothetical protein